MCVYLFIYISIHTLTYMSVSVYVSLYMCIFAIFNL